MTIPQSQTTFESAFDTSGVLKRELKRVLLITLSLALSACVSPSSPNANTAHKSSAFLQAQTTYATSQVQPDLLLNRISFGATPSSSAQMQQLGMDAYLLQQLTPCSSNNSRA